MSTDTGINYPFQLVNDPAGRYLYGYSNGKISVLEVDVASGTLAETKGSPFSVLGGNPLGIAMDPTGRFLYLGASTGGDQYSIIGYLLNPNTGAPEASLPGSPYQYPPGLTPGTIVVNAAGTDLYTNGVNYNTSQIAGFSINSTTGALTALPGSPFPGYGYFTSLAIAGEPTTRSGTLLSVTISPQAEKLQTSEGGEAQFLLSGEYSDGSSRFLTASAEWTSSNTAVATVSNTPGTQGEASAIAAGTAMITGTYSGFQATATLTVTPPPLIAIKLTPANALILEGTGLQYTVVGYYADGSEHMITSGLTWTSSEPAIASVTSSGLATGLSTGATTISAASGTIKGHATLNVQP